MSLSGVLNTQMDFRSLGALAKRSLDWWLDELGGLAPAGWRNRLSNQPRVAARQEAGGAWRLFREGRELDRRRELAARKSAVAILLPASALLLREIALPRMSGADTRRLLALDIDRLSPLSADLIHFDSEIQGPSADGLQRVRLGIVGRTHAAALFDSASGDGLIVGALAADTADGGPPRFDFLPALRASRGEAFEKPIWPWLAVAGLLALNVAVLVGRDMIDVARLRGSVEAQRPMATAVLSIRRRVEREQARRRDLVSRGLANEPLRMLSALTVATPPGAWLTRLEWNGQVVRITGFRATDVDIATALRASPMFSNPRAVGGQLADRATVGEPFDMAADVRKPPP